MLEIYTFNPLCESAQLGGSYSILYWGGGGLTLSCNRGFALCCSLVCTVLVGFYSYSMEGLVLSSSLVLTISCSGGLPYPVVGDAPFCLEPPPWYTKIPSPRQFYFGWVPFMSLHYVPLNKFILKRSLSALLS